MKISKPNRYMVTHAERVAADSARDAMIYSPDELLTGRDWYDRFMYEVGSDNCINSGRSVQAMSFKAQEATGLRPRKPRYAE